MTIYLGVEDLVGIAELLGVPAVRDLGALEAAAYRSAASAFGEDAYPHLHTKAAALLHALVRNHALVDGNERLGWVATVVFYRLNGASLVAPDDDAYDLVVATAEGKREVDQIAKRFAKWADPAER